MRWFQHDTNAKNSPTLVCLGLQHGAEGMGIFWGVLEELGDSDASFHLKITDLTPEADERFRNLAGTPGATHPFGPLNPSDIRIVPAPALAHLLFASMKTLRKVLDSCAQIGLVDREKWELYNVLYSAGLERRADIYTQRHRRSTKEDRTADPVHSRPPTSLTSPASPVLDCSLPDRHASDLRTVFEQNADNVPTPLEHCSNNVCLQDKNTESRKDLEQQSKNMPEISTGLSTPPPEPEVDMEQFGRDLCATVARWNEAHPHKFEFHPTREQIAQMLSWGTPAQRASLTYDAMNLIPGEVTYPRIVLRATELMLASSQKHRIRNPIAWLRACLFGSGSGGRAPWVQLMSAGEEVRRMASRPADRPPGDWQPGTDGPLRLSEFFTRLKIS